MSTIVEPVIGVPKDFIGFKEMGNRIPVVVTNSWVTPVAYAVDLRYIHSGALPDFQRIYETIMVDCDGDALWVRDNSGSPPSSSFLAPVTPETVDDLKWERGTKPEGQDKPLLTTVLADYGCHPLGVAYSSRQSVHECFRPKRFACPEGQLRVATLRSRSRGIWPKGLKNPNDDKDAPLPEELELSSGNYLTFADMYRNREGDALLMVCKVPEGHGFCHESYSHDTERKILTIYEKDKYAPEEAVPYRSCFHRVLLPDDVFPGCDEF